jgi:hypothetical protein
MKSSALVILTLASLAGLSTRGDVLELKGGKVLSGTYAGGTANTICLETAGGVQVFNTSETLALKFGAGGTAALAPTVAPPAAVTAAPAATVIAASLVTMPAGATLLVRLVDPISSKDPQGKRFTTTLERDLAVNGVLVARAGTKIYGRVQSAQQARRYTGQSALDLRLTEIAVGPSLIPLVTSGYTDAGAKSIGKTARGAAAGAAIGAIADGGEGAGKGAAIGAVASGLKKGETVTVAPGALLEFQLLQAVSVTVAR